MIKRLSTFFFGAVVFAECAFGCVMASDSEIHVRRDFKVVVMRYGRPVRGSKVTIYPEGKRDESAAVFSLATDPKGVVEFHNLPDGRYSITVSRSNIEVGNDTLVVDPKYSGKTEKVLQYKWAELAPSVRQLSGTVKAYKLKKIGGIFANIKDSQVPRSGVVLELENTRTGEIRKSITDESGRFDFGPGEDGIYVLHVRDDEPPFGSGNADIAIDLAQSGRHQFLSLALTWSDCGGGYELE